MNKMLWMTFIFTSVMVAPLSALAQDSDVEELNLIELELDKSKAKAPLVNEENSETAPRQAAPEPKKNSEIKSEDLSHLTDFKQVSVLQKRYLPRTERLQFYIAPAMVLNDAWFNVYGATLRLGYNFTESLGLEAGYSFMSTEKTLAAKELKKENGIGTASFVYTKSYYSLDFNWTPLYGKMTWLNEKIVYYDIYFSAGYAGTEVQGGTVEPTLHLGTGQIFSMTKSSAFRWDLTWNFFDAKNVGANGTVNNVIISAGLSFFFPEAQYR